VFEYGCHITIFTGASLATHSQTAPPSLPQRARTAGRHRKPRQRRWRPVGIGIAAAAVVAAVLGAAGTVSTLVPKTLTGEPEPRSEAGTPVARPASPRRQDAVQPVSAPGAAAFRFDQQGFVDSPARCENTETARAIGRTERSLVVICQDRSGALQYHGVRLSDDAALAAAADTAPDRRFVARSRGVSYAVSPSELVISTGTSLIKQERMVEYREILSSPVVVAPR
jgi:hypothetical protein